MSGGDTILARHGSAWVSAHAFFHGDLDLLVTHVVGPLTDELAAEGIASEFFFLRYWDGGPHLRLRVLPARGVPPGEIRRRIRERFSGYLSRQPSEDRVSAAQYAVSAPRLAHLENMRSWSTRLYPNNSVSFIAYRPEHERYGYGPAIKAAERHFVESSRIAVRVITQAVPAKRRLTLGLACTLAAWFVGCPDLGRLRSWLGNRYRGRAGYPHGDLAGVHDLARTTRQLAEGNHRDDGALAYWARSTTELRAVLSPDGVLPVLDLCAHLICNRLGVSLVNEATLRQLAVRAIDSLHSAEPVVRSAGHSAG